MIEAPLAEAPLAEAPLAEAQLAEAPLAEAPSMDAPKASSSLCGTSSSGRKCQPPPNGRQMGMADMPLRPAPRKACNSSVCAWSSR